MNQRVQLKRTKGWRMPANTVKVDRTTRWGNPFRMGRDGDRAQCVRLFERLLQNDAPLAGYPVEEQSLLLEQVHAHLHELQGKDLACWCPLNGPCHAEVLLHHASFCLSG